MKRFLSPAVAFLFILLCLPEFSSSLIAQGDNPIMIIRCRNFDSEEVLQDNKKPTSQSKMMLDCPSGYINGPNGGCVPDCGTEYTFNPVTRLCDYTGTGSPDPSFCPEELEIPFASDITCDTENPCPDGWFFLNGECVEEVPCFDGTIVATPVFDCNNRVGDLVPVTMTFVSTDPMGNPLNLGDYVRIFDLSNCLDASNNEYLQQALDFIDEDTSADDLTPRVGPANADGEIVIEFFAVVGTDIGLTAVNNDPTTFPVICEDPIPTIGQWGLMILALILSSIGLVFIARRKMA